MNDELRTRIREEIALEMTARGLTFREQEDRGHDEWVQEVIAARIAKVVVAADQDGAVGDLARAELLGALKVERERSQKAETELGKVVVSFRAATGAHNQMAAKYDEAERQLAVYRRSLEMLASDDLRAEGEARP